MDKHLSEMTLNELLNPEGIRCSCGKIHRCGLKYFKSETGAVESVPEALAALGKKKPFVVMDHNTKKAAGDLVCAVLDRAKIPYVPFVFPGTEKMEPDEYAVGSLIMAYDPSCDVLLAVGSGVINDCCKVAAHAAHVPSMVVATAPSMDGYCSNSASMIQNHIKVSLYNACPEAIVADTEIVRNAPDIMLKAGLGDMLAKYVSVCEWRISHEVHGDPYCEEIAELVRSSLKRVVDGADGLMRREPAAAEAVLEGLVISGIAMAFAEISRPASGLEHYFSHLWEMQALQRSVPSDLHGIQVGVGTLLTLWIYENILNNETVDIARAERVIPEFDQAKWEQDVREIFGPLADSIFEIEAKAKKNSPEGHAERLAKIIDKWDYIREVIREELPERQQILELMDRCKMPLYPSDLGISEADMRAALRGSREIRDKYLTSSLLWDLGLLEDAIRELPYDIR